MIACTISGERPCNILEDEFSCLSGWWKPCIQCNDDGGGLVLSDWKPTLTLKNYCEDHLLNEHLQLVFLFGKISN